MHITQERAHVFIRHTFTEPLALSGTVLSTEDTEVNDAGKVQTLVARNNRKVHEWRENEYFRL